MSSNGERVRLKCVNWYGAHQELFVSGGLEKNSIYNITRNIVAMGANCVRLPFSLDLWRKNPLVESRAIGPWIRTECPGTTLTALAIFDCQIRFLTDFGLLVILNNHNSFASWVGISGGAPQGLWHMANYTVYDWAQTLEEMSLRYRNNPLVIGMDLRNEIHDQDGVEITWGRSDNPATDWKVASALAAARIELVNPDMLIIVSALCIGYDLKDMINDPGPDCALRRRKLVYTTHVYTWAWWWTRFDWTSIRWYSLCLCCVTAIFGFRKYKAMKDNPAAPGNLLTVCCVLTALGPFALFWLCISVIWYNEVRGVGCSTLARDALPLLTASFITLPISALSAVKLCRHYQEVSSVLALALCGLICGHCLLLFLFSVVAQSYTMVENELSHWRLDRCPVPVWVGEVGASWQDTSPEWAYLLRFIRVHDLDFAYWALNGMKWRASPAAAGGGAAAVGGSYVDEPFGLLDPSYRRWRNPDLVARLFASNDTAAATVVQ